MSSGGEVSAGGGRFGAAAADRRAALLAAVAAAFALGVLAATLLPWFGIANANRIGGSVELEVTLWGDPNRDTLLAVLLVAGIVLSALVVAARAAAGHPRLAWFAALAAAVCLAGALLIVIGRVAGPPGEAGLRAGAVVALALAALAAGAAAWAARLGRPAPAA